jgi:hypothetical protein
MMPHYFYLTTHFNPFPSRQGSVSETKTIFKLLYMQRIYVEAAIRKLGGLD